MRRGARVAALKLHNGPVRPRLVAAIGEQIEKAMAKALDDGDVLLLDDIARREDEVDDEDQDDEETHGALPSVRRAGRPTLELENLSEC